MDAGTWEVGTPTSGPGSAYEGQNCAATVLAGNYSDGVDSRLIRHTWFTVPAKNQNPYLRFYHWLSYSSDDYFKIQIKEEGKSWEDISPIYVANTGSNTWSPAICYLNDYAGKKVQIAFYIHTHDNIYVSGDVSKGSYIDKISLVYGSSTLRNFEDWEYNIGDWGCDGGTWERGIPQYGPDHSYSGSYCIGTNLKGKYTQPATSRFFSIPFVVPSADKNPALRFWHWYSFSSKDYGKVQIKIEGHNEWIDLEEGTYTSTSSGVWTNTYFSLLSYADSTVRIGFYFHSADDIYVSGDVSSGWYIDDIKIDGLEQINQAPYVSSSITDTTFFEDSGTHLISEDLNTIFSDPDGDELNFSTYSDNTHIIPTINGDSLFVTSSENYFGSGNVFVTATDPGGLSAEDTFWVEILPVNDAPGIFNLLTPANKDTLDTLSVPIQFVWSQAENVDEDTIWYDLRIFNDIYDTTIVDLLDTTFAFNGENILQNNNRYQWTVTAKDRFEFTPTDTFLFYTPEITSMPGYTAKVPLRFSLMQNYPNPFNPTTTIKYALPKASKVKLEVFNLLGQKVATLVNGFKQAGYHQVTFDGSRLPSGVYYFRLQTDKGFIKTRKLVLLK